MNPGYALLAVGYLLLGGATWTIREIIWPAIAWDMIGFFSPL